MLDGERRLQERLVKRHSYPNMAWERSIKHRIPPVCEPYRCVS